LPLETGFELTLVNPFLVKQMPDKRSDAKDAQRIVELLYKSLMHSSFLPPPLTRELWVYEGYLPFSGT
jgi:transposase